MAERTDLEQWQQKGTVPVPNVVFDTLLPLLKDTELRVLLIVIRQTLGWRQRDGKGVARSRQRDWLSHSQLVRRTGRGSEAVSSAITLLADKGLILIEDVAGNPLQTAEQRRRHLGHLYFRYAHAPCGQSVDKLPV